LLHHHRDAIERHGKESMMRRLPVGEKLRYHIPGYMGYVPTEPFRYGESYGRTTHRSIENSYSHPWVYNKSSLALTLSPSVHGVYRA
jgi:hypothetical protein